MKDEENIAGLPTPQQSTSISSDLVISLMIPLLGGYYATDRQAHFLRNPYNIYLEVQGLGLLGRMNNRGYQPFIIILLASHHCVASFRVFGGSSGICFV